jgi:hypothetical protein
MHWIPKVENLNMKVCAIEHQQLIVVGALFVRQAWAQSNVWTYVNNIDIFF